MPTPIILVSIFHNMEKCVQGFLDVNDIYFQYLLSCDIGTIIKYQGIFRANFTIYKCLSGVRECINITKNIETTWRVGMGNPFEVMRYMLYYF